MEHLSTESEFEIMKDIDFIVPLKQVYYIYIYIYYILLLIIK